MVIPIALVILCLFFIYKLTTDVVAQGLIINLISDFVVIIISVLFVSRVLYNNEKELWKETEEQMILRSQFFTNQYIAIIRNWLNYSINNINQNTLKSGDEKLIHEALITFTETIILRDFEGRSKGKVNWALLFEELKGLHDLLEKILVIFNNRLSPSLFSDFLEIENCIFSAMNFYNVVPEFFTDPNHLHRPEAYETQDFVSKKLKKGLEIALKIDKILNKKNQDE